MKVDTTYTILEEETSIIYNGLIEFNEPTLPNVKMKSFACYLRDEKEEINGGLIAKIFFQNFYVSYFWVPESLRNRGYGKMLIHALEEEAIKRNITKILLDTYTFQAPEFYEKCGYKEVSRIKDYPKAGIDKIYFQKEF